MRKKNEIFCETQMNNLSWCGVWNGIPGHKISWNGIKWVYREENFRQVLKGRKQDR